MEQLAERLSQKIQTLNPTQLAEVERFVESLQTQHGDRLATSTLAHSSEPAFVAVWSNSENDVYDSI